VMVPRTPHEDSGSVREVGVKSRCPTAGKRQRKNYSNRPSISIEGSRDHRRQIRLKKSCTIGWHVFGSTKLLRGAAAVRKTVIHQDSDLSPKSLMQQGCTLDTLPIPGPSCHSHLEGEVGGEPPRGVAPPIPDEKVCCWYIGALCGRMHIPARVLEFCLASHLTDYAGALMCSIRRSRD
jgi:hypothetical protein